MPSEKPIRLNSTHSRQRTRLRQCEKFLPLSSLVATLARDDAFKRIGPIIAQRIDLRLDHRAPLIFDAESIAADDLTDFVRRHVTLSRNCENAGKLCWRDGDDGAGTTLAEESMFGGAIGIQLPARAPNGDALPCPRPRRDSAATT